MDLVFILLFVIYAVVFVVPCLRFVVNKYTAKLMAASSDAMKAVSDRVSDTKGGRPSDAGDGKESKA